MNPPAPPARRSADLAPLSPGKRVWLLTILVVLPVIAVSLPAVFIYHFFGTKPTFSSAAPPKAPNVSNLRGSLEQAAERGLPPPAALGTDAIELTAPPDRLAARAEKITRQAQEMGGSAAEGLPAEKEKHLFVELPAGRGEAFRQLILGIRKPGGIAASPAPAASTAATAASPGAKDHLEVILRAEED